MADVTTLARGGQENPGGGRKKRPLIQGPLLVPGCVYSRQQIIAFLRISADTFTRWKEAGMPVACPGTNNEFVFADDVMAILRMKVEDLPPGYVSPQKKKVTKKRPKKE